MKTEHGDGIVISQEKQNGIGLQKRVSAILQIFLIGKKPLNKGQNNERGKTVTYKPLQDRRRRSDQRHLERGLCVSCGEPKEQNRRRCNACLTKDKLYRRGLIQFRKTNRLCIFCGLPLTEQDEGFFSHNRNDCTPSRRTSQ